MSDFNNALAAMITVAGGIVPDAPYIAIRNSGERALKSWIREIVNQPPRVAVERRKGDRVPGPGFKRLPPVERFPPVDGTPEIRPV